MSKMENKAETKGKEEESKPKNKSPVHKTIPEEGHDGKVTPGQSKKSGGSGIDGAWRKPYNKDTDRRKSADLSALGSSQQTQEKKYQAKPRQHNESQNRQKSFDNVGGGGNGNAEDAQSAKDRRQAYNHNRSSSHRTFSHSNEQKVEANARQPTHSRNNSNKSRSMSTNQQKDGSVDASVEAENGSAAAHKKRMNRGSTTSNGKSQRIGSHSMNSNGESFEYDDMELDEPFSDSDDDSPRQVQKPCLIIPKGRIRTLSGTVPTVGQSPKWGGPTMCLSCLQFFNLPDQIGDFATHLLDEHHIVVVEVDLIVDPKRYIEYWRQRFAKQPVDKIFPKIVPKENDPFFGKADYYFELSERIPEDYSLRQRLAMRRLEEALGCQQREREEVNFSMQCIFCRYVARGNRSKIIHHLYMIHHLNLGSPDNLVFVGEYIDHLKEKLQRNECIYCEKTFSDRVVLMDHMRKRNHREVNPKNNYYDKFYIINYLELGKRWLDVLAEDFEDTMPTFVDSDDEEEEESWHEWQEDNADVDQLRAVCLFCEQSAEKVEELLKHSQEAHEFDLLEYIKKEDLDIYGRMKFLNFVRKQTFNTPGYRARSRNSGNSSADKPNMDEKEKDEPESPKKAEGSKTAVVIPQRAQWDTEESLVPMFGNDHFPWMLESYLEEKQFEGGKYSGSEAPANIRKSKSVCETGDVDPEQMEAAVNACLEESKKNTVEQVVAEDWPDLKDSVLTEENMYKSLR